MDGFETVRQMMTSEFMRPQTLIAVSASSAQELAVVGRLPPDVQLFSKPLDQALVIAILRRGATSD
jgi:CheY-like chemotaxis protein